MWFKPRASVAERFALADSIVAHVPVRIWLHCMRFMLSDDSFAFDPRELGCTAA